MAAYSNVMHFVKTCKDEGRTNDNIMPITFLMECHATEVNYILEKGPLNVASIHPTQVIYQDDKTTIVYWSDNTKTVVTCSDDDTFSPEAGVALCYMKRFMTDNDSERFHRLLKGLISKSKFKNSKQEDKSSGLSNILAVGVSSTIKKAINIIYGLEENHDIDTGASDNSGDNNPDGSTVEVES